MTNQVSESEVSCEDYMIAMAVIPYGHKNVRSNIANRQVRPKILSAEAKKLLFE